MRPVGLLVSAKMSGSSGSYYGANWPFSRHKLSKPLTTPSPPLPLPLSLSLTMHESICQKSGQDKDQKVRFK